MDKTEFDVIDEELKKLFVFQGKGISDENRIMWVDEILKFMFPLGAVIQGIKSLQAAEIQTIKLATVLQAIRSHIEPDMLDSCVACCDGFVVMRDPLGRWFSLACTCPSGAAKKQAHRLVQWQGEPEQMNKGRILTRVGDDLT